MPVYDSRLPGCPKGRIVDLDTGLEVEHAVRVDTDAGEVLAPPISEAWSLWKANPELFAGKKEPGKFEAEPKDPRDLKKGFQLVLETRKGSFAFVPA